jgi:cytochrome d ubiquinol oxidase subunit I
MGFIAAPLQALTGDYSAKVVAHYEPAKLAAMEAQFETEKGAPLRIGGIPDEEAGETSWAIEIPGLLSFLAHGDFNAEVIGLKDIPRDEWPPIWPVHYSFQIMVGIGFALLGLGVFTVIYLWRRRRMPTQRWYLYLVIASGPLAVLAMQLGWMVTEIGRQPWIVYGKMRTAEAVTEVAATGWLLAASIVIYGIIGVGAVLVLKILARQPLPEDARAEIDAEASAEEGAA